MTEGLSEGRTCRPDKRSAIGRTGADCRMAATPYPAYKNKNPRIHIRGFIGCVAKNQASIAARSFFIAFFSSWRTRSAETP